MSAGQVHNKMSATGGAAPQGPYSGGPHEEGATSSPSLPGGAEPAPFLQAEQSAPAVPLVEAVPQEAAPAPEPSPEPVGPGDPLQQEPQQAGSSTARVAPRAPQQVAATAASMHPALGGYGFAARVPPPPPPLPENELPVGAIQMPARVFVRPREPPVDARAVFEIEPDVDEPIEEHIYGDPAEALPWEGTQVADAPRDLPYYTSMGINRFQGWINVEPPECPHGPWVPPANHREYREVLQRYCRINFEERDLPILEERMRLQQEADDRREAPPSWMVLELGENDDMRQWSRVLTEDLEIDPAAQGSLKLTADDSSGYGSYEVNRILAHLFKDTTTALENVQVLPRRSAWIHGATSESRMALRNLEDTLSISD